MKKVLVLFFLVIPFTNIMASDLAQFRAFADSAIKLEAQYYPGWATSIGIHDYDSLLSSSSKESINRSYVQAKKMLEFLEAFDTTGWPIDDQIDYILVKNKAGESIYFCQNDSTEKISPLLYVEDLYTSYSVLYERNFAPFEIRINSLLKRLKDTPRYLNEAKTILTHPALVYTYLAASECNELKYSIMRISTNIIDSFPERNSEISTISDKARIAIVNFADSLHKMSKLAPEEMAMGKAIFNHMLGYTYSLNMDSDSLLVLLEKEFQRADSLTKYYAKLLSSKDETGTQCIKYGGDQIYTDIDTQLIFPYCYGQIDSIKKFLETKGILNIPNDISGCIIKEINRYTNFQIKYSYYNPQSSLDMNTPTYYCTDLNGISANKDIADDPTRINARYKFNKEIVPQIIPGDHLLCQMARKTKSLTRKVQDDIITRNGWKTYMEEYLLNNGWFGDSALPFYDFYNDLRFRAVDAMAVIKMHTEQISIRGIDTFCVKMMGQDTSGIRYPGLYGVAYPFIDLSYTLGRTLLWNMQQKARTKEGNKFDLMAFHTKILSEGIIPLNLIAKKYGWE